MRNRILIGAALMASISAAACSKPASDGSQAGAADPAKRAASLVVSPGPEVSVVSSLEAGRDPKATLPRDERKSVSQLPSRPAAVPTAVAAAHSMEHHATLAADPMPEMRLTTASGAEAVQQVAQTPLPVITTLAIDGRTASGPSAGDQGDPQFPVVSRGPAIIIRGGMGSARDDCDLHRRGGGIGGIAINRSAPSLGGLAGGSLGRTRMAYPSGTRIR